MARGGNAIGSASVILSANADGLVSGLDKGEKKLDRFGKNVGHKLNSHGFNGQGGHGGGLNFDKFGNRLNTLAKDGKLGKFGNSLSGMGENAGQAAGALGRLGAIGARGLAVLGAGAAAAAAAIAVVGAGALAGYHTFDHMADSFRKLEQFAGGAGGQTPNVFAGVVNSLDMLDLKWKQFEVKLVEPFGPAVAAGAAYGQMFLERIAPAMEKVANIGGQVLFVGVEITKNLGELATDTAAWAAELVGLDDASMDLTHGVFEGLKGVSVGAGYVWDSFKFGAGVVAKTFSLILEGTANFHRMLTKLAPETFGGLIDADSLASKFDERAKALMNSWGESAKDFPMMLNDMERRFDATKNALQNSPIFREPKFAAAAELGSQGAYSTEAYNRFGGNADRSNPIVGVLKENGNKLARVASSMERFEKDFSGFRDKVEVI
jgi:hypothetical protein